jgi:hypothetical protein
MDSSTEVVLKFDLYDDASKSTAAGFFMNTSAPVIAGQRLLDLRNLVAAAPQHKEL